MKQEYAKTGKIGVDVITLMDSFREERHDVLYSMEEFAVKTSDLNAAIENARTLLKTARTLVK